MTSRPSIHRPSGYLGLMEQMAAELGVDLATLLDHQDVSENTVERMMHHCAACSDSSVCTRHLATHAHQIDSPPAYCINGKLLVELRRKTQERQKILQEQARARESRKPGQVSRLGPFAIGNGRSRFFG